MDEQWKAIPGFPGYEISDEGRVRSFYKTGGPKPIITDTPQRIMRPCSDRGYLRIFLARPDAPSCMMRIAYLVMLAFVGERPDGLEIHHKDEDKSNNRLDNLEYVTRQENMAAVPRHLFGSRKNRKWTTQTIIQIRKSRQAGASLQEIADRFSTHHSTISQICTGKLYADVGGPLTKPWSIVVR